VVLLESAALVAHVSAPQAPRLALPGLTAPPEPAAVWRIQGWELGRETRRAALASALNPQAGIADNGA
jgi:hypothetical protein